VSPRAWSPIAVSSSDPPEVTLSAPAWLTDPTIEQGLRDYARILGSVGVERGLIGPREVDRLWERHILNCAVVEAGVPRGTTILDIGSGAGLPGVVWALVRPDLQVTCLEPLLRRATFLTETLAELGIGDRVDVVRGRAEENVGRLSAAVTTARAVAPLDRLARWALPLTEPGGELLALKGSAAEAEIESAATEIRRLGGDDISVEEFGHGIVDPPTRVVRIGLAKE
jgi:16S rRNA (guanine527-N7)-methyltransferase